LSTQPRVELGGGPEQGLGRLALTLIRFLHELLKLQAIRRVEQGDLTIEQQEALGLALLQQSEELDRLCGILGLSHDDLNLDLGPLGRLGP
jgi:hypothetical protein